MADRRADFEIKQILQCLRTNGYELEDIEESDEQEVFICATFKKDVAFSEMNGNEVNDSFIQIKVDFDARFDYKNILEDEEDGTYIYDVDKAESFITKLMNGTYDGKRTGKGIRKTQKNRKK
jgi:hypothetical protein